MVHTLKISVITPSFNSGNFLEKAICSVLDQDYSNYEHIVVDGGSTDNTLDILNKYKHLKWVSEKDRGQVHAMNKGFAMSCGDVIVYLNADDYFLCGAFSAVIPFFQENHSFVVGDIVVQKPDSYFINVPKVRLPEMLRNWEMNAFPYNPVGYFYSRKVQEHIPFDEDFPTMMDLRFLLESATKYEFKKIHALLGVYRCLDNTKTQEEQKNNNYWTKKNFSFLEKYVAMMPEDAQDSYERDRTLGYQQQRQWQQTPKVQETPTKKTTRINRWSKRAKGITSKLARHFSTRRSSPPASVRHTPSPPADKTKNNGFLLPYQVKALDSALSHMNFQDKRILEIGGDMKFQVAGEMVKRGAKRVVSINYAPHYRSRKITSNIESINMDIRNLDKLQEEEFDLVFGVAILEHLNDLDLVLKKVRKQLRTDGIAYLHGGPIWTSHKGHHVWIHTDDGIKYEFNKNNPIPDWGHILYNDGEMFRILKENGIPRAHSELIIDYIYNSMRLSRYSVHDIEAIAQGSGFEILEINKMKWVEPDEKTQAHLYSKGYSKKDDFETGELELVMKNSDPSSYESRE